jgi:hypothetical protein
MLVRIVVTMEVTMMDTEELEVMVIVVVVVTVILLWR